MNVIKTVWNKLKRNPVIVGFVVTVATQVWSDYNEHAIDAGNVSKYIFTMLVGVITRQLTVPAVEHQAIQFAKDQLDKEIQKGS